MSSTGDSPMVSSGALRTAATIFAIILQAAITIALVTWTMGELRTQLALDIAVLKTQVQYVAASVKRTEDRLDRVTPN